MKIAPPLSIRAALAALYTSSALVVPAAATTCDEAVFGTTPSTVLTEPISSIYVGLAGNCTGEGLFQMPRMTWTIEPNPDDSVNTTSIFLSPSNIGAVVTEYDNVMGVDIDPAAVANAIEVGVLIQAPKDALNSVQVEDGAPFFVNIVKGFTRLTYLYLQGADTCNPVRDGYIDAACPFCNVDLYTPDEVKGISSSIVADLSEVNVEDAIGPYTFVQSISVTSFGESVYNLSLALPEYGENGVPVDFNLESASSKIEIKGSFDCAFPMTNMSNGGYCAFKSNPASGCNGCPNELIIDGSINGYFNVTAESPLRSPLYVNMSEDGGCDHLAPFNYGFSSSMGQVKCTEGNVTVNVDPLPCISFDIGTLECGTNPYMDHSNESACFCVVPLPDRECPPEDSAGVSLGAVWIVSLLLPLAALFA